ncbi:Rha family transcriptional regulator [Roseateles sp.]|uniref:Rha family transcriptional regulator n=1 Tax=Roseateles sp. TaxID=1971397 RepID=UPI0032649B31
MRPVTKTEAPAVGAAQGFGELTSIDTPDCAEAVPALPLSTIKDEARMDSRLLAEALALQHRSVFKLVSDNRADFAALGKVRFEIAASPDSATGQASKFALLNEDQCYLLLTYSRNTERVRGLKLRLVQAFREARNAAEVRRSEYLPGYHQLHDDIHALAAGSPNERFVHLNVNKLVNRTAGLDAGERSSAPLPKLAAVILAQNLAARAMRSAGDHHEGFARAKVALHSLQNLLQLAGFGGNEA